MANHHHHDSNSIRSSEPILAAFGATLRRHRYERGLSLEALSHKAGLHANYLGSIERGERNVSLCNIWVIARGLELAAGDLLADLPRKKKWKKARSAVAQLKLISSHPPSTPDGGI